MKKDVRRSPISRKVEAALELPDGLFGHCTTMEWTDNRQVWIDGCCAVTEYEDNMIHIRIAGGCVKFFGESLQLEFLAAQNIRITGKIQSVEFSEE